MQTFARIAGGIVAELIEIEADGPPLSERFHPDLVATMVAVPAGVPVAERWIWDGEAFAAPVPPAPVVPISVTRVQGLLSLFSVGITEQAIRDRIAAIEDETEREITRLRFEGATWARGSEFIAWGTAQFGLSAEQADALFVLAATL